MASIHALQGAPEHSAYAATKGAITACTRALAVEVGHRGIRINAIAPGWIDGGFQIFGLNQGPVLGSVICPEGKLHSRRT